MPIRSNMPICQNKSTRNPNFRFQPSRSTLPLVAETTLKSGQRKHHMPHTARALAFRGTPLGTAGPTLRALAGPLGTWHQPQNEARSSSCLNRSTPKPQRTEAKGGKAFVSGCFSATRRFRGARALRALPLRALQGPRLV